MAIFEICVVPEQDRLATPQSVAHVCCSSEATLPWHIARTIQDAGDVIPSIRKISDAKELVTTPNSAMVPCCQCGEMVEINREKYHCQSCFNKLVGAQHLRSEIARLSHEVRNCVDSGRRINAKHLINRLVQLSDMQ